MLKISQARYEEINAFAEKRYINVLASDIEAYWLSGQEDIDHTKTKAMSPQTNGICERFHRTILQKFYQVAFRKKLYGELNALQSDLDE